jgi:tRNA dimethylallyltransferase
MVVIGGPSASGKSALALRLAEAIGGVIVNADSMQLYRELPLLTARPTPAEEARAPHRLYGILDAADPASVGRWLELAGRAIEDSLAAGRVPIVVGGTGLYIKALLHGLAPVPEVPAAVRQAVVERLAQVGAPGLHAELARQDPAMAARLGPNDRQRLLRAVEVLAATGRSLGAWQAAPALRVRLPEPVRGVALLPPRPELHRRIERRLQAMIDAGALAELAALRAARPDPGLPLLKAVAVPELLAHLEGRLELAHALARALARTRQYAKRQMTWLRHQLPELQPLHGFGDELDARPGGGPPAPPWLTDAAMQHSFRATPQQGSRPADQGAGQARRTAAEASIEEPSHAGRPVRDRDRP